MDKEAFIEDILEIYSKVIADMDEDKVKNSKDVLQDMHELDSLGLVEFVVEIEEKYNISLDDVLVDIIGVQRVEEVINIIYDAINK